MERTEVKVESYRFIVHGRVQGVFYRKFVAQKLRALGIQGYVRNLPDGTVEVVARLSEDQLDAVLQTLKEGSPMSEVEDITVEVLDEDDLLYDGFEIRYE
ncbi:acylphosphatase [Nitratifractor salsuginis DSM 16511]|uniref:acylphosphatase n=1 Tax=Nitratifractor salsuginis (strain DSM 16511 / JCM 12458 / E9I37-1) TaxID=749222 RepID=E6WYJ1_NITSE|nr:acylphosphatase [Nitratifractor salsuginis DSM 16511]